MDKVRPDEHSDRLEPEVVPKLLVLAAVVAIALPLPVGILSAAVMDAEVATRAAVPAGIGAGMFVAAVLASAMAAMAGDRRAWRAFASWTAVMLAMLPLTGAAIGFAMGTPAEASTTAKSGATAGVVVVIGIGLAYLLAIAPYFLRLAVSEAKKPRSGAGKWLPAFPRLWDLLGVLFTRKFREQVWQPSIEEDKADYYEQMAKYRGRWARMWLRLCFLIRTFVRLGQALWVAGIAKVALLLSPLVPGWLQSIIRGGH